MKFDNLRHFSSYTLKRDKIHDIDKQTSIYIQRTRGQKTNIYNWSGTLYSTLNDRINPTDGFKIRFDIDYYGLIGDSEHFSTELKIANF